jgi:hypothetical protein
VPRIAGRFVKRRACRVAIQIRLNLPAQASRIFDLLIYRVDRGLEKTLKRARPARLRGQVPQS